MLQAQQVNPTTTTATAHQIARVTPLSEEAYIEAALRQPVPRQVRYSRGIRFWRRALANATAAAFASVYALLTIKASLLPLETKRFLFFAFIVFCEFCVIAVVGTLVTAPRLGRQAHLLRKGVAVTGTMVRTPVQPWREGNANHVTYTFRTARGATYTHTVSVPTEVLKRVAVGDQTTILYDPNNHAVSYPYNAITVAELV